MRWMAESLRPFMLASDRGFQELMKTGRPGQYIPSASTISRELKVLFALTRVVLSKMLRVSVQCLGQVISTHRRDCECRSIVDV